MNGIFQADDFVGSDRTARRWLDIMLSLSFQPLQGAERAASCFDVSASSVDRSWDVPVTPCAYPAPPAVTFAQRRHRNPLSPLQQVSPCKERPKGRTSPRCR